MFDLMNLLFNAGMLAGKALGITLYALSDVNLPQQLGQVAPIEMSSAAHVVVRVRPKTEEERCIYRGVVVPYEQLWEERRSNILGIETVAPPQPGKIAAYAIIINRKDCEGRAPEAMFRVAEHRRRPFNSDILMEGASYMVLELGNMGEDSRPKWVPQVVEVLAKAAESDPIAKDFVQFSEENAKAAVAAKSD